MSTESEQTPDVVESPEAPLADSLDIGSQAQVSSEPSVVRGKVDKHGVAIGTGRRKTAVARVRVRSGSGAVTVNERPLEEYFPFIRDREAVLAPLGATGMKGQVDVWVRVTGGGPTGQSGAVSLGIARALQAKDSGLHSALSEGGYLTRDGRMVERKKYGRRKARRSFQFSKR